MNAQAQQRPSSNALSLLKQSLKALEKELASFPVSLWPAKPRAGGWSIAEILHHLVLVEVQGLQELKDVMEGRQESIVIDMANRPDLSQIQFSKPKLKSPDKFKPTTGIPEKYLLDGLHRGRRETIAYVQKSGLNQLSQISLDTPWIGVVNGGEFAECLAYHMFRHAQQIAAAGSKK